MSVAGSPVTFGMVSEPTWTNVLISKALTVTELVLESLTAYKALPTAVAGTNAGVLTPVNVPIKVRVCGLTTCPPEVKIRLFSNFKRLTAKEVPVPLSVTPD